jgi:hypothetical protein
MLQVIRLAAGEGQCPSPESKGFFESGGTRGGLRVQQKGFNRISIVLFYGKNDYDPHKRNES